jgi:tetratricopeptide (TPR) repeat protein
MINQNFGITLIKSGKYEKAAEYFTKWITADDQNAQAYYLRAKCYAGLNRHSQAMNDLYKAIDLSKEYEDKIIEEAGDFENLHMNPFFVRIAFPGDRLNSIVELMYENEFEKSANELENYMNTGIFNFSAYFFLSICCFHISDFEKAIWSIDTYIQKNPYLADAYFNKACILDAEENYKDSETEYLKALELDNSNINILYNLANLYLITDKLHDALQYFNKTLEMDPVFGLALFKRAIVFSRTGEKENAGKDLKKLVKIDPNAKEEILNNEYLKDLL